MSRCNSQGANECDEQEVPKPSSLDMKPKISCEGNKMQWAVHRHMQIRPDALERRAFRASHPLCGRLVVNVAKRNVNVKWQPTAKGWMTTRAPMPEPQYRNLCRVSPVRSAASRTSCSCVVSSPVLGSVRALRQMLWVWWGVRQLRTTNSRAQRCGVAAPSRGTPFSAFMSRGYRKAYLALAAMPGTARSASLSLSLGTAPRRREPAAVDAGVVLAQLSVVRATTSLSDDSRPPHRSSAAAGNPRPCAEQWHCNSGGPGATRAEWQAQARGACGHGRLPARRKPIRAKVNQVRKSSNCLPRLRLNRQRFNNSSAQTREKCRASRTEAQRQVRSLVPPVNDVSQSSREAAGPHAKVWGRNDSYANAALLHPNNPSKRGKTRNHSTLSGIEGTDQRRLVEERLWRVSLASKRAFPSDAAKTAGPHRSQAHAEGRH